MANDQSSVFLFCKIDSLVQSLDYRTSQCITLAVPGEVDNSIAQVGDLGFGILPDNFITKVFQNDEFVFAWNYFVRFRRNVIIHFLARLHFVKRFVSAGNHVVHPLVWLCIRLIPFLQAFFRRLPHPRFETVRVPIQILRTPRHPLCIFHLQFPGFCSTRTEKDPKNESR